MEDKVLKSIWEYLSSEGKTTNDFETLYKNVSGDEEAQINIHSYLLEQKKTDSNLEQWLTNTGIKKKRREPRNVFIRIYTQIYKHWKQIHRRDYK